MGEVPPSDDPRDVGRAKRVLWLAVDLWCIVRAEPEPHHIKFPGKIRNGLGFRPFLVRCKESGIEMVVPNLEKHVISLPQSGGRHLIYIRQTCAIELHKTTGAAGVVWVCWIGGR